MRKVTRIIAASFGLFAGFGGLDFAVVFAQFGRDEGQPKRFIDFFFGGAQDFTGAVSL